MVEFVIHPKRHSLKSFLKYTEPRLQVLNTLLVSSH